ncbi:MAG: helix-turn-helix domain-containing protein [Lachnospirales bacterium]
MSTVKTAVVKRFKILLKQKNMTPNALANISGVTPSTVYSIFDPKRKDISIITIKKLCDGLELSLGEFFSDEIFDEIEQEIK